jgi:hypothetical protein
MPGLTGRTPDEAFEFFRQHIATLLNRTITDGRVSCRQIRGTNDANLRFAQGGDPVAVPLFGNRLFLYLAQYLTAEREPDKTWRLRTLQYAYRIQDGPSDRDACFFRFEYVNPRIRQMEQPRHHLHIPATLPCGNLEDLHIPTGWVAIEELIRFLITELGVRPRVSDWNAKLIESENVFREWTTRTV